MSSDLYKIIVEVTVREQNSWRREDAGVSKFEVEVTPQMFNNMYPQVLTGLFVSTVEAAKEKFIDVLVAKAAAEAELEDEAHERDVAKHPG